MKQIGILFLLFAVQLVFSQAKKPDVIVQTPYGDIKIILYDKTPKHKANFIKLAKEGYYDGLLFHRVIPNFMIQGGDPDSKGAPAGKRLGEGGPDYTIPFEYVPEYFHKRGALAAARMPDEVNPARESSGSQFYIVQGKTFTDEELDKIEKKYKHQFTPEQRQVYKTIGGAPHLDGAYTVFGEVIEGMDVVDKIASLPRDKFDRPLTDVPMKIIVVQKQ